ncbi:MAG: hypothetical protein IKL24_03565 [Clostridia bacterium]|nr:hypothetical protein [Clostridia bacterium]
MKRYISILLAIVTVLALALSVSAEDCTHSYLRSFISPTCLEKGHTLFRCQRCGHTYKVYDDEYTAPEDLYILAESVRDDNTLTVTVSLFNNPGITAARIQAGYNASTLSFREFINGEIWTERDFTGGINTSGNPITIFTEDYSTGEQSNVSNGVYFTLVFDIIDPNGAYGFYLKHNKADFHQWKGLVTYTPTIINLVGKNELGPHSYTDEITAPTCEGDGYTTHTCTVCGDSYRDNYTDSLPHSFELSRSITAPDFENEGTDEYVCTDCGATELRAVPVLEHWKKGDLNGDLKINAIDANLMRRLLAGMEASLQMQDAADTSNDGKLNAIDANILKHIVSGA